MHTHAMSTEMHLHFHGPITVNLAASGIIEAINQLKELIIMNDAEATAALTAATNQIAKIGTETSALIQKVNDLTVLVNQQGSLSPELQAAVAAVQAQVQVVDDLVPDAPAA